MTITSIGYGDIAATSGNELELLVCVALMLVSGIAWANFIAGFVDFLGKTNAEVAVFREMIKDLNEFMARQKLARELQQRLREYFHQTAHLREAKRRSKLLVTMSPALQEEVTALHAHSIRTAYAQHTHSTYSALRRVPCALGSQTVHLFAVPWYSTLRVFHHSHPHTPLFPPPSLSSPPSPPTPLSLFAGGVEYQQAVA